MRNIKLIPKANKLFFVIKSNGNKEKDDRYQEKQSKKIKQGNPRKNQFLVFVRQ
ncbi:MAG: hypothetical protein HY094_10660 [Candidatus Melainabacteria bacterium]|nr:hypothetical protein [Candidatus Melainabacteria bacterium]